MSVASWSRQYFGVVETADNTLGTPSGSALNNNLPALLDSAVPTFTAAKIGIEGNGTDGGKHKLLLSNKPAVLPNTAVQDDRKTTGTPDPSEKDIEITIAQPSETELEMNMSAYAANLALLLLFQQGASESYVASLKTSEAIATLTVADAVTTTISGTTVGSDVPAGGGTVLCTATGEIFSYTAYATGSFTGCVRGLYSTTAAAMAGTVGGLALVKTTFVPYNTAEPLHYLALVEKARKLYGANPYDESVLARGCIASSFNLGFDEGGVAKGSIGVLFAKWLNTFDAQAVTSAASVMASLKWQNAYVYLTDWDTTMSTTDHKIWLQSMSLNGSNNASAHFYNSDEVKNFTLNDLVFNGSLAIPWVANAERDEYYWEQIDTFRNGLKKRLVVAWGHEGASDLSELGQADNGMTIDAYIQYSASGREGDNIILHNMDFKNILPEGQSYSITFNTFTYIENLLRGL